MILDVKGRWRPDDPLSIACVFILKFPPAHHSIYCTVPPLLIVIIGLLFSDSLIELEKINLLQHQLIISIWYRELNLINRWVVHIIRPVIIAPPSACWQKGRVDAERLVFKAIEIGSYFHHPVYIQASSTLFLTWKIIIKTIYYLTAAFCGSYFLPIVALGHELDVFELGIVGRRNV